jgi:hypothetical protein
MPIRSFRKPCISLAAFLLLSSLSALARRSAPTQASSNYGQANGQAGWLLAGPDTITVNSTQVSTEVVCPQNGGGVNTTVSPEVCFGDYLFLYQIPLGPDNLVLTFSGLSGFAFNTSSNPTFGVLSCDPSPAGNMLCTNLIQSEITSLNVGFDAWAGNLVIAIPSVPSGGTLTIFIQENPPSPLGGLPVPLAAPILSIGGAIMSPPILTFGSQEAGTTSVTQTVTVVNSADFSTSLNVTGSAASAGFASSGTCTSLTPGEACDFLLSFSPSAVGNPPGTPSSGTFTLTDDSPLGTEITFLSGVGSSPGVTISPSTFVFGSQVVGKPSAAQSFTVTNSAASSSSLTIHSITPGLDVYAGVADFSVQQDSCTGNTIAPGANCQASIVFSPSFPGWITSTLSIADTSTDGVHIIDVMGTANDPQTVTTSESALDYGDQAVGTASAPQTVTVTNASAALLNIAAINATAEFTVSTDDCTPASPIAASASCTVSVEFNPVVSGSFTGTLTIADNSVDGTLVIPLSGTGVSPTATLSSTNLDFGGEVVGTASGAMAVTVSNGGNGPLAISAISITGANQGDFAVQSNSTCGTTSPLPSGSNCTINVVFTAQAGGARSASLGISDNALGGSQSVMLSGTGMDFTISPSPGSATVSPGSGMTYTATLTGVGGFTGTLQMSCSGAPAESTCTPSSQPATLGASGTTQATFNVTTTAPSGTSRTWPFRIAPSDRFQAVSVLAFFLSLVLLSGEVLRRKGRSLWPKLGVMVILTVACLSCGGGSTKIQVSGTLPGQYTLTLSATSGNLTQTTTVILTVQ